VSREGLDGRVHLLGLRGDVPRILAGCDLLLLIGEQEALVPGALMEARLAGLPTVCFGLEEGFDFIRDGQEGRVVPAGDVPALAEAITDLARDPERRAAMGREAAARAAESLPERALPMWEEAFRAALAPSAEATVHPR
jgi:glycosyltransferase involved in cell wall biosynthesis